jgi:DNA-directed RNA polymerase alpha subunit/DNA-directed RNA polymerase subunit L
MNPIIKPSNIKNSEKISPNSLCFTLSGVNVSLANAVRRTILSDIPTVVFKTTPYEENKANIIENTTRLNNEIIKQRLSCIPIHMKEFDVNSLRNIILVLNEENTTEDTKYVTTENFKIQNVQTKEYMSKDFVREIFPANDYTGYFIDFVRLKPKLSDKLPGEKIHLTCEFSIGTAKEDGMFNVASTCSYGCTPDLDAMMNKLALKKQEWKDSGMKDEDIEFEANNWKLLDGLRYITQDSFDFIIDSVGVYTNTELLVKACDIIVDKLEHIHTLIDTNTLQIVNSQNTMSNCFDAILPNEDYTIGKVIEYILYSKYYEGLKTLTFCGFKKMHPHDSDSIIRVAYRENVGKETVARDLKECIGDAVSVFRKMKKDFANLE